MLRIKFIVSFLFTTSLVSQTLTVNSGATVTIGAGSSIASTNVSLDGGTLIINSDDTNSGTIIASGDVNAINSGKIQYNRYIPSTNWHIVGPPVSGQTVSDFIDNNSNLATSGNLVAIGKYDNTQSSGSRWVYYDSTNPSEFGSNLDNGVAYIVKLTTPGTIQFEGGYATVNGDGDVVRSMQTASDHRWFTVSNPLPAYMPGTSSTAQSNILDSNSAIFDSSYTALYTWDTDSWVPANSLSDTYFPPGSGFMMKTVSNSQQQFKFAKSLAYHRTGTESFLRANNPTLQKLIFEIGVSGNVKHTEVILHENGTRGIDKGYDAGAYENPKEDLDIRTRITTGVENDDDFVIQVLSRPDLENLEIPLSVYATPGKLSMSVAYQNIENDLILYLEDRENNTFHNLTDGAYKFNLDNSLRGPGRFFVHTVPVTSTDEDQPFIAISDLNMFNMDSNMIKVIGINDQVWNNVEIYSVSGNKVYETRFNANREHNIKLPQRISSGIYIAVLTDENGNNITRKIAVK